MKSISKHIAVIGGSVRPENNTMKAVRLLEDELRQQEGPLTYEVIDPAELELPLPGLASSNSSHDFLQERVERATGIILASPEYHGGISSVMKLVIDNLGFPSKLAGKPVALLGVASGVIGAVKSLEQIRSICSHVGAIVLPAPVSVPLVHHLFDSEGRCGDPKVEKQIRGVVHTLLDYIDRHICPALALESMVREEKRGI